MWYMRKRIGEGKTPLLGVSWRPGEDEESDAMESGDMPLLSVPLRALGEEPGPEASPEAAVGGRALQGVCTASMCLFPSCESQVKKREWTRGWGSQRRWATRGEQLGRPLNCKSGVLLTEPFWTEKPQPKTCKHSVVSPQEFPGNSNNPIGACSNLRVPPT